MPSRLSPNPKHAGFTLVELLVVVMIIGIIAAIAVPNLINSINRARQKKTMVELRSLGTALQQYGIDYTEYPAPASYESVDELRGQPILVPKFIELVVPTYIKSYEPRDGWGRTIYAGFDQLHHSYSIASWGRDGFMDAQLVTGATTDLNNDIIYSDGTFLAYPIGIQH